MGDFLLSPAASRACLGQGCTSARAVVRREPGVAGEGCSSGESSPRSSPPLPSRSLCVLVCLPHCQCHFQKQGSLRSAGSSTPWPWPDPQGSFITIPAKCSALLMGCQGRGDGRRALDGIPEEEGDDPLELNSLSPATGTTGSPAEGVQRGTRGHPTSQNKCRGILSIVSH